MATFKPISFIAETISVGGEKSRPERDFAKEQQQNRQSDPDIKRQFRLGDDDFKYVTSIGNFPKIVDHDKRIPLRRRDEVEAWFSTMRRIVAAESK